MEGDTRLIIEEMGAMERRLRDHVDAGHERLRQAIQEERDTNTRQDVEIDVLKRGGYRRSTTPPKGQPVAQTTSIGPVAALVGTIVGAILAGAYWASDAIKKLLH